MASEPTLKGVQSELSSTTDRILGHLTALDELTLGEESPDAADAGHIQTYFDSLQTAKKESILGDLLRWAQHQRDSFKRRDGPELENAEHYQQCLLESIAEELGRIRHDIDTWDGRLTKILRTIGQFHIEMQSFWERMPQIPTAGDRPDLQLTELLRAEVPTRADDDDDLIRYLRDQQKEYAQVVFSLQNFMHQLQSELSDLSAAHGETLVRLASAETDMAGLKLAAAQKDDVIGMYQTEEHDRLGRLASRVVVACDSWVIPRTVFVRSRTAPVTIVARKPSFSRRNWDYFDLSIPPAREASVSLMSRPQVIFSRFVPCEPITVRSTADVAIQTVKFRPAQPDPAIRDLKPPPPPRRRAAPPAAPQQTEAQPESPPPEPDPEPEPEPEVLPPPMEIHVTRDPPEETHDEQPPLERTNDRARQPMIMISTQRFQFSKTARPPPPKHPIAWEQYGASPGKLFKPLLSVKSARSIQNRPPDHGPVANEATYDGMN
jgi:hypothetical protein